MEIVRITIPRVQPATKTPPKRQQFHLNDVLELLYTENNVVIVTIS